MAAWALGGYVLYILLAFGLRTLIQIRRTGSSGFNGFEGRVGSAEWAAGLLFTLAVVAGLMAPLLVLAGLVPPIAVLESPGAQIAGVVVFALGAIGTLAAQVAMGDSWRIGVSERERTDLVTSGPFGIVRNPIFAAMLPAAFGLALMVPSPLALAAFAALFVAVEMQVRIVEEPYLARVHGSQYSSYVARVGRFAPALGLKHGRAGE